MKGKDILLTVRNVSAGYNNKPVVNDVSFDLFEGECMGVLGLNGSGKTTLLKGICGLIPLINGTVTSAGIDFLKKDEKQRARFISYIPQRHSALGGVSVKDAVLMGKYAHLGAFTSPSETDIENAHAVLEKMGILHLSDEDFSQLSEGQKQLVILSRTLLQNTPVVLMDEPDAALDYLNKRMMLRHVREMTRDDNKSCLITLHDPFLAMDFCDRLILLDKGSVVPALDLRTAERGDCLKSLSTVYGELQKTIP